DFNPSAEFWCHTDIGYEDKDAEWLTLTYNDNEALSKSIVKEIEKGREKAYYDTSLEVPALFDKSNIKDEYWNNWWKVYGLGMVGTLDGVIFQNWAQIDNVPREARLIGYGIDFGFTNDPTSIVALYNYDNKNIWDEVCYQTGMTNGDIANVMKDSQIRSTDFIIADSAEPKSIAEINRYGFSVQPADKGADSVNFGIDVLQQEPFLVTKRSTNLINELRKYMWAKDRDGKTLNVPIDAFNHCIDPMRYLATKKLSKHKQRRKIKRRN
ncbi:MAG: terminase large subunit, partial [Phocaeicola sp.]